MHRVAAKFVPGILRADQKQQRVNVWTVLRQLASDDETSFSRGHHWWWELDLRLRPWDKATILPVDKLHVTKAKKARQFKSNLKGMIITFFGIKGIVHKEFVPTGRTANSGFYCEVMRRLRENVRRHRPQLWREHTWLFHHDNARITLPFSPTSFRRKTKLLLSSTHRTPLFGILWLLPIYKNEIEAERTPVRYHWRDPGRIAESAWHSDRKGIPGSVPKMEERVGPVSTCGRELLRGRRRPIGFMVSFMIFTA